MSSITVCLQLSSADVSVDCRGIALRLMWIHPSICVVSFVWAALFADTFRWSRRVHPFNLASYFSLLHIIRMRIDEDIRGSRLPDRTISSTVSRIGEGVISGSLANSGKLVGTFHIVVCISRQDIIEHSQMCGNLGGVLAVGSGGQNKASALFSLLHYLSIRVAMTVK